MSVPMYLKFNSGSYTGDGATARAITGVGFKVKALWISKRLTDDGDATIFHTWDTVVDDHANGLAFLFQDTGSASDIVAREGPIKSLDEDGFTVDDGSADLAPNKNTEVYNWYAIG